MSPAPGPSRRAATGARARRRSLVALAVALVLALSTWFSAAAVLPGLRAILDLSPGDERLAVVALQLAFAVTAAATAVTGVADRIAPRRLAVTGALVAALANSAPVVALDRTVLFGSRAAVGAALALVYPTLLKVAGTWAGAARGQVLGAMIAALTLGSASPHLVNGVNGIGWSTVLLITSVAALIAAAVIGWGATDGPGAAPPGAVNAAGLARVLRSRSIRLTCLGYVGHMWELYAGWAAMAPFMLAVWGAPRPAAIAAFAVIAVGCASAAGGGRAGDRLGRERAAILAMVVSGSLVTGLGFSTGQPLLATALALVWGMAVIADSGQFPALVVDHAEPGLVGSALSVQMALGFSTTVAASWLVPTVQDVAGWGWALACLAPGPLLGALALHRLRSPRLPAHRPARAPLLTLERTA